MKPYLPLWAAHLTLEQQPLIDGLTDTDTSVDSDNDIK